MKRAVVALALVGCASLGPYRRARLPSVAVRVVEGEAPSRGVDVAAPDGRGTWRVAVDGGALVRVRAGAGDEPVADRFGLAGVRVRALCGAGRVAAFLLDDGVAVADGTTVTRYALPGALAVACGGGTVVARLGDGIEFLAAPTRTSGTNLNTVPGSFSFLALDGNGRLYAATSRAVYADDGHGGLALAYVADDETIRGLVEGPSYAWFLDGDTLGTVEPAGAHVAGGAAFDGATGLAPAPSGDVTVLARAGARRVALATAPASWEARVAPVFRRACAACHLPGGAADVDLSTESAWVAARARIRQLVLVERKMPPRGRALDDADRATLEAWLAQ